MSGNLDERLRLREDLRKLLCKVSDKYNISMSEQTQITRMLWDYDAAVKAALAALPEAASDERLKAALQASVIALDDWLHEYAPEWCGEPYVTETRERIASRGGTLAYIAKVQQENRAALAALPEASPRDPSPTPWDFSTWGFYCDACKVFFDLVKDGRVETHPGNICTRYHKCGKEARYIGYLRTAAVPEASEPSRRERHIYVDEATNTTHIGKPAAPEASGEPLAAQHEHTPHAFIDALTGRDECIRCGGPEIAHAEHVREVSR